MLKAAIFQGGHATGVQDNLGLLVKAVRTRAGSLHLMVFPELFLGGYVADEEFPLYAEYCDGPSFKAISLLALECEMAIAYGYVEKDPTHPNVLYNSAQLIDKNGNRLINYRKTHLWGAYESKYFTPAALLICFDVEFPEVCRCLALSGANLFIVPTALVTKLMTTVTVVSRALENHAFLMYSNLAGKCSNASGSKSLNFIGNSVIVAPDGTELARGRESGEDLLIAQFNWDNPSYKEAEECNNYLHDRRPELYTNIRD